jgi:K+-sensing histidine kinase KdpD
MKGSENRPDDGRDAPLLSDSSLMAAAHELKAPIALIRQLGLMLETEPIDKVANERMIRQIVLTSERALRLTADLTRSSRLEDSLFDLEPLNPQQLCEEVAHELTPLYRAQGREIRVASRYRPILALANRDLLRRVILNFGDNALHYGGEETPVELYVKTRQQKHTVRVAVRDYGPALPSDIWQRLQQQLGVNPQFLHNRPQSSGLGLFVAGQFARAMRSELGATRHHDGATFFIDINASKQLSLL